MSAALNRKLGQAHDRLQAGDADGAQSLCQQVLQRAPRNPDALSMLAVALLMRGRASDAIPPLEQALAAQPRHGVALENLGLAHLMLGHFSDAEQALEKAAMIPGAPGSVYMRLGVARLNQDKHDAALNTLEHALKLEPQNPDIHLNLGQAADRRSDPVRARLHFEAVLKMVPSHVDALFNLGVICLKENEPAAARKWFEQVLGAAPRHAEALVNLGLIAEQQNQLDEAIAHLRHAIEINPSSVQIRNNLAHTLSLQGRYEEAREQYEVALRVAPDSAAAREGVASVCIALGRFKEGIAQLRELIGAGIDRPEIMAALADALFEIGEIDEAETAANRALQLDPTVIAPYTTLADIHSLRGELDLMVKTLQTAFDKTGSIHVLGKLTFQLRRICDWKQWANAWRQLAAALPTTSEFVSPFSLLCEPLSAIEHLHYARRWSAQFNAAGIIDVSRIRDSGLVPFSPSPSGEGRGEGLSVPNVIHYETLNNTDLQTPRSFGERIRVGYFSSDFYEHATAYLLAEVLELHDRARFEIFAYSYGPEDHSPMRSRLRSACEHFIDIARDPDDVAAARIRDDHLDILVDLKGYTMGARPSILARRPCAVQMSWVGYPGSMGAKFIDYLIADPFIVPAGHESHYAERVLRLPHCYQPNDRKRSIAEPRTRVDYGLPENGFVFCGFNQAYKITPEVFSRWMNLLRQTPGSVLWLLADNSWATENLMHAAQGQGIDPSRLVFAPKLPLAEHLARYRIADLALDTFPYGSHTTASDALWSGCLLVALCGEPFAARVSGSIVSACGLPELVTHTLDDYERLALHIAADATYRDKLRLKLEANKFKEPLFDSRGFVLDLESIYHDVVPTRSN